MSSAEPGGAVFLEKADSDVPVPGLRPGARPFGPSKIGLPTVAPRAATVAAEVGETVGRLTGLPLSARVLAEGVLRRHT